MNETEVREAIAAQETHVARQRTVKDFTVGQTVTVHADQGHRIGTVTALGRTRVTVKHPRNKEKTRWAERPYPAADLGVVGEPCRECARIVEFRRATGYRGLR